MTTLTRWDPTDDELVLMTDEELELYARYRATLETSIQLQPTQEAAETLAASADEVLYGGAAYSGKALALDTPVPTPTGWTTMGELRDGDEVFDERGQICRVVRAHAPYLARDAYRLTFQDGASIVADGQHRWPTLTGGDRQSQKRSTEEARALRRATRAPKLQTGRKSARFTEALRARNRASAGCRLPPPPVRMRTTIEIAEELARDRKRTVVVPLAHPLDLPDRDDLSLDPYVLGIWLGDGSKGGGGIATVDREVLQNIDLAGWHVYQTTFERDGKPSCGHMIHGLKATLRAMGLIGNKHVPAAYLRAGFKQRLALLQGLMDSDGSCDKGGRVGFGNTNKALADAVYELAASLGHRPSMHERRATLYGKDCGPVWSVSWVAPDPVFRILRKLDRQQLDISVRSTVRHVRSVVPVEPTSVRCVTVDSSSHLYLAGRAMVPTHNTFWGIEHVIAECQRHSNNRALILRRVWPSLRRDMLPRLRVRLNAIARWHGGDKALALDTPVPTPTGWTTMGELRDGDEVFDERGQICRVVRAHAPYLARDAYRLTFQDGASIVADGSHRWPTMTGVEAQARPVSWVIRTTQEIHQCLRRGGPKGGRRGGVVMLPLTDPLDLPDRDDLPLDPYVLGIWLGDGCAWNGTFATLDDEVVWAFEQAGFQPHQTACLEDTCGWATYGLHGVLRKMGLLRNKHVPNAYLRASFKQRLALLQGLMDSDGHCGKDGKVSFGAKNRRLADAVYELATSLGHRVAMSKKRASLGGRDCGDYWTLRWFAPDPVFRIVRKLDRQRLDVASVSSRRYVREIVELDPISVRCITVDSSSHLYLAGNAMIPTHNTFMFTNGSVLELGHLQYEDSWSAYQGSSYGVIFFEELTEFLESQFENLRAWVRVPPGAYNVRPHVVATTNPGGVGHRWVKRRFVRGESGAAFPLATTWMAETPAGERLTRAFVPATSHDNPLGLARDPGYLARLRASISNRGLRRALESGDWDAIDLVENALWGWEDLDGGRVEEGTLDRIGATRRVVAIDPSDGLEQGNEFGLWAGGKGADGVIYTVRAIPLLASPRSMATTTLEIYRDFRADALVVERNHGGRWLTSLFKTLDPYVNIVEVWASEGKRTRAEPVAALFERDGESPLPYRARLEGRHPELEEELTTFAGTAGEASPNVLDALVWGHRALLNAPRESRVHKLPEPTRKITRDAPGRTLRRPGAARVGHVMRRPG